MHTYMHTYITTYRQTERRSTFISTATSFPYFISFNYKKANLRYWTYTAHTPNYKGKSKRPKKTLFVRCPLRRQRKKKEKLLVLFIYMGFYGYTLTPTLFCRPCYKHVRIYQTVLRGLDAFLPRIPNMQKLSRNNNYLCHFHQLKLTNFTYNFPYFGHQYGFW